MNINGLNSAASGATFKPVSSAYIAISPTSSSTTTDGTEDTNNQDTVSISNAGRAALATDVGATLRESKTEKKQQAEAAESGEATSPIDQQIERIKEQIKALQEMLTKLKGDNSEAAEQQRKVIQEQILQLNSQMAVLMDKKMRDAQKSAE